MKHTLLLLIGLVVSLSLSAQKVMRIEMNDGTFAKYTTSSIKQITFEDMMTVGTPVDLGLPSGTLPILIPPSPPSYLFSSVIPPFQPFDS